MVLDRSARDERAPVPPQEAEPRPLLTDARVNGLIVVAIPLLGLPLWALHRGWTYLRTGRWVYP